jgi:hypothetical protein
VFRRRKSEQPDVAPDGAEVDDLTPEGDPAEAGGPPGEPSADRSSGPFDLSEAPEDGLTRLDLGALRIPGVDGMELRLDVDETGEQVIAVTVVNGESALQLMVFAAPRTEGIWTDVRGEIKANLAAGGPVDEVDAEFGRELLATITVAGPSGKPVIQPVRFIGIDGPRWFVRGLFSGDAARDRAAAVPLEAVLRATVVVRGTDAMAPGDPLGLRVPTTVPEGMSRNVEPEGRPTLPAPQRGPEITEIR